MSLWDMLTSITGTTFAAVANFGQAVHMFYEAVADPTTGRVGVKSELLEALFASIGDIERIADDLNLDATKEATQYCLQLLRRGSPHGEYACTYSKADTERISWTIQMVRMNFTTQMQSRLVIVLDTRNASYLISDEPPFGREVDDAFPNASEDISEAAKCLALNRPTAVVFHLMRAMESAVQSLATALGCTRPDEKVWGIILADIHRAIEAMPKGRERDAWSASHAHLYHVKQAWRNDTMHPKTTHTEDQAQAVFEAVRSFMTHLAPLVAPSLAPL